MGILQHYLPKKAAKTVKQLGKLNLVTGKLQLKASLRQHLSTFRALNEYE